MRHQIKCSGCPEQARPGQAYCTACQKRQRRKHYEENKATYIARAKASKEATRALIRAMVLEAKTDKVCADCLLPHPPWRLQFDHLGVEPKEFNIADASSKATSVQRLQQEIRKCELVCANCHADRTHARHAGVAQR